MRKPLVVFVLLALAFSSCAVSQQEQQARAKAVALHYLAQQHSELPKNYTIRITRSEWIPELAPSEIVYVVDFMVERRGKEKTLYSVPVSAERFEVMTFDRMGVLTPLAP